MPTPHPRHHARGAAIVIAVVIATSAGCAGNSPGGTPPTDTTALPGTASAPDELVRVTGTVVAGSAPGCLLLDTGVSRYALVGGDPQQLVADAEVTVTGVTNQATPTPCAEGTPLAVSDVVQVD